MKSKPGGHLVNDAQRKFPDVNEELQNLRAEMIELADKHQAHIQALPSGIRASAANLLHYLALRRHELRPLQDRLSKAGLSSLGRSESQVLATIDAVLSMLQGLNDDVYSDEPSQPTNFADGAALLEQHTEELLGPKPAHRGVRIMVTMPSEAARDYTLVHDLVQSGMDCMRINCAHDDAASWERMIAHLRKAEQAIGRSCRVFMDLAGPKLRTGPVEPACGVIKYKPRRDPLGQVTAPARIWLTDRARLLPSPTPADACLALPAEALHCLESADRIGFRDARGARREMEIVDRSSAGCWAVAFQTAYLTAQTVLKFRRRGRKFHNPIQLGRLPDREQALDLQCGDTLVITRSVEPGRPASYDSHGRLLSPACIGCTLPEIFDDVQPGEHIWLDDGKIGGVLRSVDKEQMLVQITHASANGDKLRGDKGINLPDSNLRLAALTAKDLADLPFIVERADAVSYSFVRRAEHVEELRERLAELHADRLGIILKIETREAFDQLPNLLLGAMKSQRVGVMIARGDLAVQCGYERLAEVQEEILWMCEAAHVPVIWATQVLEKLAKEGMPSRAEISDAAAAGRAECVMLNKGPNIIKAVKVLDDILQRMQAHQRKKRSMLRPLSVAKGFDR